MGLTDQKVSVTKREIRTLVTIAWVASLLFIGVWMGAWQNNDDAASVSYACAIVVPFLAFSKRIHTSVPWLSRIAAQWMVSAVPGLVVVAVFRDDIPAQWLRSGGIVSYVLAITLLPMLLGYAVFLLVEILKAFFDWYFGAIESLQD